MAKNNYSFSRVTEFISDNFGMILIAVLFLLGGFFIGSVWTENQTLKAADSPAKQTADSNPQADAPTPKKENNLKNMPKISDADHIRGAKKPKLYLVEYSDYECPYCQRFHPTMNQVIKKYGDQVAWIYRYYPLTNLHPNAQSAAEAAECVAELAGEDAFWGFTDAAFAQNKKLGGKLSPEAIDEAIKASGADLTAVKDCVESGEKTDLVTAQMNGGAKAGISGTPGTILVTSKGEYEFINGALPFTQVSQLIEKYL